MSPPPDPKPALAPSEPNDMESLGLRARVEELERALEDEREASATLRALDDVRNSFLAAVSHDLRTPLAAIIGLALTLERHDLDPAQAKDLAGRIASNARRLDRMVTDLLDLDRLSKGIVEPALQPVDLAELVSRTVAESDVTEGRTVSLDVSETPTQVDPAQIERIVENLLANAVRHTPDDSRIWVSVHPEEGGALIVVEDDGPGVPTDQRIAIFEPFHRASEHRGASVGIGLAVVARFAGLHGGRAWVDEREGGGASFRVWLPGPHGLPR